MHASGAEDLVLKAEDKLRYRSELVWNSRGMNVLDRKRLFKVLLLKAEHSVVDCLERVNFMFPIPVEERTSENRYNRYLDFVYTRHDASRRRELIQNFAGAPAPSPALGSPSPSPAVGSTSPSPNVGSRSPFPKSQSHSGPPSPPFFPRDVSGSNLQPTSSEQTSSGASTSSGEESSKKKTVLIAVLVTASVTLVVSLLLFLCFRKTCGTGAAGRNDESPLLSLSMSDYSVGMSRFYRFIAELSVAFLSFDISKTLLCQPHRISHLVLRSLTLSPWMPFQVIRKWLETQKWEFLLGLWLELGSHQQRILHL